MREFSLERTQVVRRPLDEAWAFYSDVQNLEAITPAWLRFRIVRVPEELRAGAEIRYRLGLFGVPIAWTTVISEWRPPRSFTDVQTAGPYVVWEHTHRLNPVAGGTEIHDHVLYKLPPGAPPRLVRRWLDRIFDYRAARTAALLG
jgi:ligand-binding SRPBCC domain-containing protein